MKFEDLIVVVHWEWDQKVEEDDLLSPDRNLKSVIGNWRRKVRFHSEVFEQKRNLIVTSDGWYGALYGDTMKDYFEKNQDITYHYPRYKNL